MSLYESLTEKLAKHTDVLGFNPVEVEQRSFQWHTMRLGVITASGIDCILAKAGSVKRGGYMSELIAEIATGAPKPLVSAKALEWGINNEPAAIDTYQFTTGEAVRQIPFFYRDDSMRAGCSPDGVMEKKTLELKCPWNTIHHIDLIVDGVIKKEYQMQCQFQMWCMGTQQVDFMSFDPRMRKSIDLVVTIDRNDEMMKCFDDAIPQFVKEMDAKLERLGFKWGDQW